MREKKLGYPKAMRSSKLGPFSRPAGPALAVHFVIFTN